MVERRVICLADPKRERAKILARAMADGIARHGDKAFYSEDRNTIGGFDVAVAYGWRQWGPTLQEYLNAGRHYVFIDGAYFGRSKATHDEAGYHKVVVDERHPQPRMDMAEGRFREFGLAVKPWRAEFIPNDERHILLAGMSHKNAADLGWAPEAWERKMVVALQERTGRRIVYRPKPTFRAAAHLPGTLFSPPEQPLADVLKDCFAVVTHHSNVAIDGLLEGVPCYAEDGAARMFSMPSLDDIVKPIMPDGREAFMFGVGYLQWTLPEMRRGDCWDFVKTGF